MCLELRSLPLAKKRGLSMRRPKRAPRPTATFEELSQKLRSLDPAEVYSQLLWWDEHKGYKRGWVYYKFKRIFGSTVGYDNVAKLSIIHPNHELLLVLMLLQKEQRREYDRERRRAKARGEDPGRYSRAPAISAPRPRTWYTDDT